MTPPAGARKGLPYKAAAVRLRTTRTDLLSILAMQRRRDAYEGISVSGSRIPMKRSTGSPTWAWKRWR